MHRDARLVTSGVVYSLTDARGERKLLQLPDQENIIDTATYVLCMKNPAYSTNQWLAMAPAKNCTVKNAPGKPGTNEHIVELSMPEVTGGEPVVWKLTWALSKNQYKRFMKRAGRWLVTYQH